MELRVYGFFFSVHGCEKTTQKLYKRLMHSTSQRGMGKNNPLPAVPLHYGQAHMPPSGGLYILIYHRHMSTRKLNLTNNHALRNLFWLNLLLSCSSMFQKNVMFIPHSDKEKCKVCIMNYVIFTCGVWHLLWSDV